MKAVFIYFLKIFFRNKGALLGAILTPLLFLILFGFIFGEEEVKVFKVGIYPYAQTSLIKTLENLSYEYKIYKDFSTLKEDIQKKRLDIGIKIDKETFTFYYNKGDLKNTPIIKSIIDNIITKHEEYRHKVVKLFSVKSYNIKIGKVHSSSLGYIIPGVISMSILSVGMFSIIEAFSRYRKLGILKRLSVTPMNPLSFMSGIILGRLLIGILTSYLIYLVSALLFNLEFSVNLILFTLSLLISGLSMSGLGALIVLLFKEANTASNVGSILFTIMLFFSGIYFPINFLPKGVRVFSYIFPLTYVAQNLRYAMGVEYINYKFFILSNLIMLICGLIFLKLVSKKYLGKSI